MKVKLILISLLISVKVLCQSAGDGEKYFNSKQYLRAKAVYESLLKKSPGNALYNYRYARCCYELKDVNPAILHFERSGTRYSLRDLYLGELYYDTYQFDKSVMAYQTYIASLKPNDSTIPELEKKIALAEKAAKLMGRVEDIAIVDSVVVDKSDFLQFYKFSSELGSLQREIIKTNLHKQVDKITYTTQRQARMYYSDLVKGQMDLFTTFKLLDEWSQPTSLSDVVNTSANENYPFLLLDGITLYFASDGENSIGGYDIFVTRFMSGTNSFLTPQNIGMPFNSPFNDYMMVIDEQQKLGWFATDRYQPEGKVVIYTFVPAEIKSYIRSEDPEVVRNAARLFTYRKAKTVKQTEKVNNNINIIEQSAKEINFAINDTVIYVRVNEFKSPEALALWNELNTLEDESKQKNEQLSSLREKYNSATDDEKKELTDKIVEMEKKKIELKKLVNSKTVEIRNVENKFLLDK